MSNVFDNFQLTLELSPNTPEGKGYCDQGCGDCPLGAQSKKPFAGYSEDVLNTAARLLKEISEAKNAEVNLGLYGISLPSWTVRGLERFSSAHEAIKEISVITGKMDEEPESLAKKISYNVGSILECFAPDLNEAKGLTVSVTPERGETGLITNTEEIIALTRTLQANLLNTHRNRLRTGLYVSLDSNFYPKGFLKASTRDHLSSLILQQGFEVLNALRIHTTEPIEEIVRIISEQRREMLLSRIGRMYYREGPDAPLLWAQTISQRLMNNRVQKQTFQPWNRPPRSLGIYLSAEGAWVNHRARFTHDPTTRYTHQAFQALLDRSKDRTPLDEVLKKDIEKRREAPEYTGWTIGL